MKNIGAAKRAVSLFLALVLMISVIPACFAADGSGSLRPGDTVVFGSYEQNAKSGDGQEPLEWIVLRHDGDAVLLITRYVIDCVKYNNDYRDVTWEDSDIRRWLNSDFIDTAFSSQEYGAVLKTVVYADTNPDYGTDPGYDTEDRVFLLSVNEVYEYFDSNRDRNCMPTAYAIKRGAAVNKEKKGCWWWLRTPGKSSKEAAYVIGGGSAYGKSAPVNHKKGAVRPAVWVSASRLAGNSGSAGGPYGKSDRITLKPKVLDFMFSTYGQIKSSYPGVQPEFINAGRYYVVIPGTGIEVWFQNPDWSASSGDRCESVCGTLSELVNGMPQKTTLELFSSAFGTEKTSSGDKANTYSIEKSMGTAWYISFEQYGKILFPGHKSSGGSFSGQLEIDLDSSNNLGPDTMVLSDYYARLTVK